MKIGILNCLNANDVCAGTSCLKAFNTRTGHFSCYTTEQLELAVFARCNGCNTGLDAGFREKLERMVQEGVQVCHIGVRTVKRESCQECQTITQAALWLEQYGIRIVRGTHF